MHLIDRGYILLDCYHTYKVETGGGPLHVANAITSAGCSCPFDSPKKCGHCVMTTIVTTACSVLNSRMSPATFTA